jgi:hypothetical protein
VVDPVGHHPLVPLFEDMEWQGRGGKEDRSERKEGQFLGLIGTHRGSSGGDRRADFRSSW